MNLSSSEIYRSWKEAKNQESQIGILSELNACSKKEIREIIEKEKNKEASGIKAEEKERKKPGPKPGWKKEKAVATSQPSPEERQKERINKEIACEVVPEEVRKAVTLRMQDLSDEADRIAKEVMTLSAWLTGTRR